MKKLLKLSLALIMVVFLSACCAVTAENKADYSDRTLTGKITSVSGSSVTLQIGKLKQDDAAMGQMPQMGQFQANGEMPQMNGELPELPSGDMTQGEPPQMNGMGPMMERPAGKGRMPQTGQLPNEGEAPQMAEGQPPFDGQLPADRQMPDFGNGEMPQMNGELPELPSGDMVQGEVPQMAEGQMPQMGSGRAMKGQMSGSYTFKEGKETLTVDLSDADISLADGTMGSVSDLKIGDVVSIDIDANGEVTSAKVCLITDEE